MVLYRRKTCSGRICSEEHTQATRGEPKPCTHTRGKYPHLNMRAHLCVHRPNHPQLNMRAHLCVHRPNHPHLNMRAHLCVHIYALHRPNPQCQVDDSLSSEVEERRQELLAKAKRRNHMIANINTVKAMSKYSHVCGCGCGCGCGCVRGSIFSLSISPHIHTHTHIYIYIHTDIHIHTPTYTYIYICVCVCMCMCMYVCVCV